MNNSAQLPFLPVSLHTLAEAPFFASKNAGVVRAGFYMLEAGWRSSRPGSIPSSFSELAAITRLSESDVESHYACLTSGWDLLDDGRLHHFHLETICESISERFGAELAVIADAAVVAIQGGEAEFALMPSLEVIKKKRGKHHLPKDFCFDKPTLQFAINEGYTTIEYQQWALRSFCDFATARAVMYTNWQAAIRNFISSDITRKTFRSKFNHMPGEVLPSQVAISGLTAKDRLRSALSFQQRTTLSNSERMHAPSRFMAQDALDERQRSNSEEQGMGA